MRRRILGNIAAAPAPASNVATPVDDVKEAKDKEAPKKGVTVIVVTEDDANNQEVFFLMNTRRI